MNKENKANGDLLTDQSIARTFVPLQSGLPLEEEMKMESAKETIEKYAAADGRLPFLFCRQKTARNWPYFGVGFNNFSHLAFS
jgi:hypothetical protein